MESLLIPFLLCLRKQESVFIKQFWPPASAGATAFPTFYEIINLVSAYFLEVFFGPQGCFPDIPWHARTRWGEQFSGFPLSFSGAWQQHFSLLAAMFLFLLLSFG